MTEYANIKSRIFEGLGVQVLNRDDPMVTAMCREGRAIMTFGVSAPEDDQAFWCN